MAASRRILVLLAHPVLERSRVNRRLADAAGKVDGVTVRDLYELYPTLDLDVAAEQDALLAHDVVVFQHPFYWYSAPAILKEWLDLVLEHGWAYGPGGDKLAGKLALNAISAGGPQAAYRATGYNRFTVRELLAPWDQTAHLCKMRYLAPFVVHGSLRLDSDDDVRPHVRAYVEVLEALRDGRVDLARAAGAQEIREALEVLS